MQRKKLRLLLKTGIKDFHFKNGKDSHECFRIFAPFSLEKHESKIHMFFLARRLVKLSAETSRVFLPSLARECKRELSHSPRFRQRKDLGKYLPKSFLASLARKWKLFELPFPSPASLVSATLLFRLTIGEHEGKY